MSELQNLLTDAVVAVEQRPREGDAVDERHAWPEELAALGTVVEGRRRDYVLGRRCAREAIEALGHEPLPILSGPKREPLWPGGLIGAITHTQGYVAAAVARQVQVASVGIDAEPDEALPGNVIRRIARPEELEWVDGGVAGHGVANRDRLLFSAKEAVYKAWFPLAGRWLGFDDARLSFDAAVGRFTAEILVDPQVDGRRLEHFVGRYTSVDGVILTAVEVLP